MTDAQILDRFREICGALPSAEEYIMVHHPAFRIAKKPFAILNGPDGQLAISVKVEKTVQAVFLKDPRFYRTPYIGQHGWVSLPVTANIDWEEVAELVQGSYRLTAPTHKTRK